MADPELNDDFVDLLGALNEECVEYVVVGAHGLEISGVGFDEAWRTRVEATLGTELAQVIGREALLQNKRAAGRDKDLLDVKLLSKRRG